MSSIYGKPLPSTLYKYLALTSPEQRGWLRDTLLSHRAYWATPDQFNDPFDCYPIYKPLTGRALAEEVRALVKRVDPNLNRRARLARERELMRTPEAAFQERLDKALAVQRETAIYSLTTDETSILMWSHYACSHQGVCLRFDAGKLYDHHTPRGQLGLPVHYSDERPMIVVGADDKPNELLRKVFLVKAKCWEYEGEWRFIEPQGGPGLRDFPPDALTGIILGAAIGDDAAAFVKSVLTERAMPIVLERAVFDGGRYQLAIEPVQ